VTAAGVSDPAMPSGRLASALRMHEDMLLGEAQAFVGKD